MRRQVALSLLTFIIVLSLVLAFWYWSQYRRDEAAQLALVSQIGEMRRALASLPAPEGDPNRELALARERLERARGLLPEPPDSNEIVRRLLELGRETTVEVIPLAVEMPTTVKVGKHSYGVQSLSLNIRGHYSRFLDLVKAIDGMGDAVVVESLVVSRVEADGVEVAPGEVMVAGTIDIAVYSRAQESTPVQGGSPR